MQTVRSILRFGKEDAITNWAVLVGKALWCYMKGAGQVGQRSLPFFSFVLIRSTQANPHHKQHVMFFLTFLEKSQVKSWAWFQLHLTLDLAAVREQRA